MGLKKTGSDGEESNYVSPVSRPPCQALAFLEPLAPEDPTLGGNISNLISISFGEGSLIDPTLVMALFCGIIAG